MKVKEYCPIHCPTMLTFPQKEWKGYLQPVTDTDFFLRSDIPNLTIYLFQHETKLIAMQKMSLTYAMKKNTIYYIMLVLEDDCEDEFQIHITC